ncbi:hypothetical protein [uncultured Lutibacter sp.]|uniref:hypothetical protein n=1 Tax=uncultured Lutibacter sp. TaxID=437739 RepID=UPI0026250AD3|nr:hypothetical protein [uncultured Lutibacter sp.]
MKTLKFIYLAILFFPIINFGQTTDKTNKLPDFMNTNYAIVENDTVARNCFCFDRFNDQIGKTEYVYLDFVKRCKSYQKKYKKNDNGYWNYNTFLKMDSISKLYAEYINIDNQYWVKRTYKDNKIESHKIIKLTDRVSATEQLYNYIGFHKDTVPKILYYMETEITD